MRALRFGLIATVLAIPSAGNSQDSGLVDGRVRPQHIDGATRAFHWAAGSI